MKQNYTLSEAAKALGVSKNTIINWEKNNKIPKIKRDTTNGYRILGLKEILDIAKLMNIKRILVE